MNIADRALAAHQAEVESRILREQAQLIERKARAFDGICQAAEEFGLTVTASELNQGSSFPSGRLWWTVLQVDDDVSLRFTWELPYTGGGPPEVTIKTEVSDQLYWDLPPGEIKKGPGGGTYGCFNLTEVQSRPIGTLADLGRAIRKTRDAREQWNRKHGVA